MRICFLFRFYTNNNGIKFSYALFLFFISLVSRHSVNVCVIYCMFLSIARMNISVYCNNIQVKEEESSTLETVQNIQAITVTLHKAKDICMQKGIELEKLKKDNASQRELEKAEAKFKKAQDDCKTLVEKYTIIRNDFETKMTQACRVLITIICYSLKLPEVVWTEICYDTLMNLCFHYQAIPRRRGSTPETNEGVLECLCRCLTDES